MITSVSNPQMKRIKELLNKSKQRRKEKCFVAEGIRMVAETPADRLERVYVSESFYRHPPELRGLDLSKALIVDDQVFRQVSDTQTPQGIMAVVRQQENSLDAIMKQPDALLLFLENIIFLLIQLFIALVEFLALFLLLYFFSLKRSNLFAKLLTPCSQLGPNCVNVTLPGTQIAK